MNRRHLLKAMLATGAALGLGGGLAPKTVRAEGFSVLSSRVLVNIMLFGGPNLRYLFPPQFDPDANSFGYKYWESNASAHLIDNNSGAYQQRWENDFDLLTDGTTEFGILKTCGWLKSMWDAGHVAIICNAVGGKDRNHPHCILQMDLGDLTASHIDIGRSGWGGRITAVTGGNVLSLTRAPRGFCYGPDLDNPNGRSGANLIALTNTRDASLFRPTPKDGNTSPRSVITRSLESYYAAKGEEINPSSIYYRFIEHEKKLRFFGDTIKQRLDGVPLPPAIEALYNGALSSNYLGEQIRNLYDSFACSDILAFRVASLEYGSWDSHKEQRNMIEPMLQDLFGTGKALDSLYSELPADAADNMVLVLAGEFGRQLRSNGANGTDHGEGNAVLVIGRSVRGGVYGEMFPEDELSRLGDQSPQIMGKTEIDHIFGAVADWMTMGAGDLVFPRREIAMIEPGVNLGNLFV